MSATTTERLSYTKFELERAKEEVTDAEHDVATPLRKRLIAPIVWLAVGVAASVYLISCIPHAGMGNGKNWAAACLLFSGFAILIGAVGVHEARDNHRSAPSWLDHTRETVTELEQEVASLKARLADEQEQKRWAAIEAERTARLHATMSAFAAYVATLPADADDATWAALAAEHGWSPHLGDLMRVAVEAQTMFQPAPNTPAGRR